MVLMLKADQLQLARPKRKNQMTAEAAAVVVMAAAVAEAVAVMAATVAEAAAVVVVATTETAIVAEAAVAVAAVAGKYNYCKTPG